MYGNRRVHPRVDQPLGEVVTPAGSRRGRDLPPWLGDITLAAIAGLLLAVAIAVLWYATHPST